MTTCSTHPTWAAFLPDAIFNHALTHYSSLQSPDLENVGSLTPAALGYKYTLEKGANIVCPAFSCSFLPRRSHVH